MSKKLIAVAAAAVLALAGLAAPASAASSATLSGAGWVANSGSNDGSTAVKAATLDVPYYNEISESDDTAGAISIDTDANSTVTVTATGGAKLLEDTDAVDDNSADVNNTNAGRTSLTIASDNDDPTIYVFTTTTAVSTVTVNVKNSTTTYNKTFYLKGIAGEPYFFNSLTGAPSVLEDGDDAELSVKLTDVFGNEIKNGDWDGDVNASLGSYEDDQWGYFEWNESTKVHELTLTSSSDLPYIFTVSVDNDRSDQGFKAPADPFTSMVNGKTNSDLAKQVAALEAKVAGMVTKKRFNKLAKKWNAAFPSKAVSLKK